jgi:hypothetical protein
MNNIRYFKLTLIVKGMQSEIKLIAQNDNWEDLKSWEILYHKRIKRELFGKNKEDIYKIVNCKILKEHLGLVGINTT